MKDIHTIGFISSSGPYLTIMNATITGPYDEIRLKRNT